MIDAKDLRIGNLFKWKGHIHHIIGIISWGEIEIHLNKTEDNKEAFICRDITELEPITLEDEWLEKFGFKNGGYDFMFWNLEDFELSGNDWLNAGDGLPEYAFNYYDGFGKNHKQIVINYIHTLQNLVHSLTQKELTVQL